ncbi:heterokaryon incompatibility protein-domain-containing protein, partial [Cercophora newfieldiana]
IRLLRVRPSLSLTAPIECTMCTDSFDANSFTGTVSGIPYSAISYRWSEERAEETIFIDGRTFKVHRNVYEILRYHRPFWGAAFIWIDAICINQADDMEKEVQVPLMRSIYEHSLTVECW